MTKHIILFALAVILAIPAARAQEKGPRSGYQFTTLADVPTTPVKDQQSVGTCWDYATLSFLETELLRLGYPAVDLAELYVARNAYYEKGVRYIQFHGRNNFSEGGQAHDVIAMIKKYGILPEEAYTGLHYGRDFHIHGELVAALKGILDGVNANPNERITPTWTNGFRAYIDSYLGAVPDTFTYQGRQYTPLTFAASLPIDLDDYVELTSYTAFPLYQQIELPIPDNWMHERYYNLPIDELMRVIRHALENGYSVCWDGDVSHSGFQHRAGLAILPTNNPEQMINSEISKWTTLSADEQRRQLNSFIAPVPEMKIDDAARQAAFDSRETTDDHLMHLTGILRDQNGTLYYKTKNSWAADSNPFEGYLLMSDAYCRLQTVAILVHRDAIPRDIRKKLGL